MPRSYNIKTESRRILRRYQQHLLLSKEPFKPTIEVNDDITPADISSRYPNKSQKENPSRSVNRSSFGSYSSHLGLNIKPSESVFGVFFGQTRLSLQSKKWNSGLIFFKYPLHRKISLAIV